MKNFELVFNQFLECIDVLQKALNVSYGEALAETFDNLENNQIRVEMGAPDKATVQELGQMYQKLDYDQMSKREKVLIFNYLVLKAITEDGRDINQMPTPPVLATVFSIIMQKLLPKHEIEVVDPALGTGSLLYSVIDQLRAANHSKNNYRLAGIDNDEEMLTFADIGAHLNELEIDLYRQDAMEPWMVKADAVVSDLPVGFYPLDNNAKKFELKNDQGHSFAHYLFIEQIVKNLNPDGFAFLLVPTGLFSGKDNSRIMTWLAKKVYLNLIVDLPEDMFKNKFNQKSILVFQNHGPEAEAKDVFISKIGSLKDEKSLAQFNLELDKWYTNNK